MQKFSRPRFITISFSHYCEKARWAMDRRGYLYDEDAHLPGFHRLATRFAGARGSVPVLLAEGRKLDDSTDILLYVDEHGASGTPLVPEKEPARSECLTWEERFDTALGPHTRRLFYFHLLKDRGKSLFFLRRVGPGWQKAVLPWVFPMLGRVMRRMMRIDAEGAQRSRQSIDQVFAEVAERLKDGRRYLLGDTFSAADLTFAALAAPVLRPEQYAKGMIGLPPLSELPPVLAEIIEEFRRTPAGVYALRLYAEERLLLPGGPAQ
jgi:glutathione S-transferase